MKYIFLSLFFNFYWCFSQEFNIPVGYTKVLEVKGDLNKDGIEETVVVYNTDEKEPEIGFKRVLCIFEIKNGKRILLKKNATILRNSTDNGFYNTSNSENADPLDTFIVKKNTLIIQQKRFHNSRRATQSKLIFRCQENDWFLIGSTCHYYDTCLFEEVHDINFSTNKVHITKDTSSCDDDEKESHSFKKYEYNFSKTTLDTYKPTEVEIKKGVYTYY